MSMYLAAPTRYGQPAFYRRCGRSGVKLPLLSLGLWHNFGGVDAFENAREIARRAFDSGITHFDLANNYGPPPGSAEETFGRLLRSDFSAHRDEILISTKAGYLMWSGPYGEWGSRKSLLASLDASLRRLGVDYVDIFYSHRFDPETPLEETMGALHDAVRRGKALYVGISNYDPLQTARAGEILRGLGTPCLLHQQRYNLLDRRAEAWLFETVAREGIGCIVFSPLAQGLLSDRYLEGIPVDSRAARESGFLRRDQVNEATLAKVRPLNELARSRGQTLAQMAIAWTLRETVVTSALIGVSRPSQLEDCLSAVAGLSFSAAEVAAIDEILGTTRERTA
jgi:L-glyceraldehyde 3-phosphate reductase